MRIRSVKPEYFTHPEIVPLSIPARLLFISLWTQVDDEGRIYDQPRKLCANAFGDGDRVNPDKLMEELAKAGRVNRYEADGKPCLQVVHFSRHQRIDKPRPSTIPPGPFGEDSPILPGIVVESSQPDLEGIGREGKGRDLLPSPGANGGRARDEFFEVLLEVSGWELAHVTTAQRGETNKAAKQLREVNATPPLIRGFGDVWFDAHPDIPLRPQLVTNHWASYMAGGIVPLARGRR